MSDISLKLLNLINEEYTLNEITSLLGLSNDEIYKIFRDLKDIGINFNRSYYYSGDIVYLPKKELDLSSKKNCINLITKPEEEVFRAMVISDLHAGSIYESKDSWYKIYDYCIVNNIHNIIICGDFLDGISIGREDSKLHNNSIEQIEYALSNYPFDKNILNYVAFGNHDIDSLVSYGIDFEAYLNNYRHDIVSLGYGYGRINIKNDKIFVTHPLCIGYSNNIDLTSNYLLLKGHHHCTKSIIGTNGNCSLTVPSLSNIFVNDNAFLPGAIDLTIKFKKGYFDTVYYEHLLINDKIYTINSIQYNVMPSKDRKYDDHIKNEDDLVKRRTLKKEDNK